MFGLDAWIASFNDGTTLALVCVVAVVLGLRHATDPDHLAAVVARSAFRRATFEGRLVRLLPAASALVILAAGLAMTLRAVPKVS